MDPGGYRAGLFLLGALAFGPIVTPALGQNVGLRPDDPSRLEPSPAPQPGQPDAGEALYLKACANCHGSDGTGVAPSVLGFDDPPPADFTDCSFASREPNGDWAGIVHDGGPSRVFSPMMPAFGDALSREEIDLILDYIRGFCGDDNWPRGELNLPLPLATEKAFPEDEAVLKTTLDGDVSNKLIYEKRFGSRTQIEVVVPFGWKKFVADDVVGAEPGGWRGGIGDVALGVKRVLFHSLSSGTIVSLTGEVVLPTGDPDFGKGYTVLEPFLTMGQFLPFDAFVHLQMGLEIPTNSSEGETEGSWRAAFGRTFTQGGEWGRAWSPMVEILSARAFEDDATTHWDLLPQVQVALNKRQHIRANFGVRFPLNDTVGRDTQLMFYLLWDTFDGGFFEGW